MDAEKNVVEAARAVVATRGWDLLGGSHEKIVALRAALSAYDSAPAPSEDRVREAVEAVEAASLRWVASVGRPDRGERNTRIADAMRPYVTPAPALPAGTVAVSVETLKKWRKSEGTYVWRDSVEQCSLVPCAELDAILPPPPRPEPSAELVAKWEREAMEYVWEAHAGVTPRDAYVAALRAAWEDNPERKP